METQEFLSLILPSQGVYFSATPREEGGFNHVAHKSVTDLANRVRRMSDAGHNTYFACAGFEFERYEAEPGKWKRRTQENALFVRSQWVDIDCGNDEYPSQKDGLTALFDFCKKTSLPKPNLLVNSGNGIHAYWVFDRDVEKEVWERTAGIFKRLAKALKFAQTDTTRTADIASVLRPIGTNNDKSHKGLGVKEVKLIGTANPEPLAFRDWVAHIVRLKKEYDIHDLPDRKKDKEKSRNSDLIGEQDYPESTAELVANKCAQIKFMRDYRGANQPEPVWYQALGILAYCVDGLEKAHEWSSGYEKYSPQETLDKFNQRLQQAGPSLCDSFQNGPCGDLCNGCKYAGKIKSPIILGRPDPEHQTEIVVTTEEGQEVVEEIPELPENVAHDFAWSKGLLLARVIVDDDTEWHPVCAQLPIPQYVYYDQDSNGFMMRINVRVRPFVWREADISMKSIAQGGALFLSEMGSKAGVVPRGNGIHLVRYMRTWAETIQRDSEEVAMHTHIGWYDDGSFLLGTTKYMPDGTTKPVRVSEGLSRVAPAHEPTGDLDTYIKLINQAYNRPDHEMYQFTWLASCASPLLRLVSTGPVGIPLVAWSKESGMGKTTAALAGVSVWGNPWAPNQVANANKVTEYALYVMAGMRRDIPVVLDEATMWEPHRLAQFAYDYSDGRPKVQGAAGGGLRDNSNIEWSNFIYVNANNSVVDLMANSIVNSAPQIARVWEYQFDISHDKTMTRGEGNRVFDELWKHYAVAGDAFLRYIVPNRDSIKEMIFKVRDKFAEMTNVRKDARNWLMAAATVWVAYMLTKQLGMHEFDGKSLKNWIVARLARMQEISVESQRDLSDIVASMVADLQPGFIVTENEGDRRAGIIAKYAPGYGPPRGAITGRLIVDQSRLYVTQAAARRWCNENRVAFREVTDLLKSKGWLLPSEKYYLAKGTTLTIPQSAVLAIDTKNMGSSLKLVGNDDASDARASRN